MANLAEKIFAVDDIQKKRIKVHEWGDVEIEVRSMSGAARSAIQDYLAKSGKVDDMTELYISMIIESVYDPESGEKVFKEVHRDLLRQRNAGTLERIAKEILMVSGFDDEAQEEAEKN